MNKKIKNEMTFDQFIDLLVQARLRYFKSEELRGYFESELLAAKVAPNILKRCQSIRCREVRAVWKTKDGEPERFYYLRGK